MSIKFDPGRLYRSPEGYNKVIAHYDKTFNSMGIPYQSLYVETSFGPTQVVVCGEGNEKPVVLWHGQNANASTFVRWIPVLAKEYQVFAVDTIGGLGKSAPVRLSRKGPEYEEWAAEVVRGLDIQRGNMIGVSNGGWLVLKLGSNAPDLVGSAILLSSAGFMPISIKLMLQIIVSALSGKPPEIAENLVKLLSPPDLPPDPFYVEFFELILTSKFRSEPISPRIRDEELKKFHPPTYLLMGQYETSFNPYRAVKRAVDLLPQVMKAEIVPVVGHSMEHKKPDWVISRITDFLNGYAVDSVPSAYLKKLTII
ncbi:MAG: alpha/beta hydrolase [Anaerolineales bacterium]